MTAKMIKTKDDWAAQYQKYLEGKYEEELKGKRAPEKVDDSHKR